MATYQNIKGGEELQALLNSLAPKLEQNIMRGAMRAGAKVILEEAKRNVPVKSGELRNSLKISTKSKKGTVTASVKSGNKKVYYSRFVEFGVAAHSISATGKGFLNFGGIFAKSVDHPGATAKPFMRPAIDSKSTEAIDAVKEYIGKRLTKEGINTLSESVTDNE